MERKDYFRSYYQERKVLKTEQKQLHRLLLRRRNQGLKQIAEKTSGNEKKKQKTKVDEGNSESLSIMIRQQEELVKALVKVTNAVVTTHKKLKQTRVPEHQPSEFELRRQDNILRNAEFLKNLRIIPKGEQNSTQHTKTADKVASSVPTVEDALADEDSQFWLEVGDAVLTEFMVPYGDGTGTVSAGALVGRCFDTSPGYFFGIVGRKEKRSNVNGHFVNYTDGDIGWLSLDQLRLLLVEEDKVLELFPNVRKQVEDKMGKGVVLL